MNKQTHKYQHKIPQVYMKAWAHSDDEIFVYRKEGILNVFELINNELINNNDDVILNNKDFFFSGKSKKISEFGGENDFYTITKDSLICTEDDLKRIKNGEERILDIEHGWQTLENTWNSSVKNIINNTTNTTKFTVGNFRKTEIISFMISMLFRGSKDVENFKKTVNLLMDSDELISQAHKSIIKVCLEELETFSKDALLGEERKLFQGEGLLYKISEIFIENFNIMFCKAPKDIDFITSDNPCVYETTWIKDKNGNIKNKNNNNKTLTMAVTPKIIMVLLFDKEKSKKYKICRFEKEEVKNFNRMLLENSYEWVMSNKSNIFDLLAKL